MTTQPTQVNLFEEDLPFTDDLLSQEAEPADLTEMLGYLDPPILLVETDPDQTLERQRELMETVFGGIGQERKVEKRLGLAMQQLDVEQRHALRLLLCTQDVASLVAHLARCLADPVYGYGQRGDQGRTIAQAMSTVGDLAEVAAAWLDRHRDFQQQVLSGVPFSFRSLFDTADLDSFVPLVQRVGDQTWQLGVEGEGKQRRFEGDLAAVWPKLCDTYVTWSEADNESWLSDLKRRTERRPNSLLTVARAERLRKVQHRLEGQGPVWGLLTEKDEAPAWPRSLIFGDQVGLSRLSGHAFYEVAWEGGLHLRRFELSSTTRHSLPQEHLEIATALAETLALEAEVDLPPVTAVQVEVAYLRRLKVERVRVEAPEAMTLPEPVSGQAVACYQAGDITALILHHDRNLVYATAGTGEAGVLIQQVAARDQLLALTVKRGQRGQPLQTVRRSDLDLTTGRWLKSVAAWAAWLAQCLAKA